MAKWEQCSRGSTAAGGVDETFEYIFACGTRVSGMTLLMIAMANGHAELAEALLRRGADVSLQTGNGGTALVLAAGTASRSWSSWHCSTARRST